LLLNLEMAMLTIPRKHAVFLLVHACIAASSYGAVDRETCMEALGILESGYD